MNNLLAGVIVYYNDAEGKNFGFILPDGRKDTIFFHNTQQKQYECDGETEPVLKDYWTVAAIKGERVLFVEEESRKGLRAKWWVKESTLLRAQEECSQLKTYRLRTRYGLVAISRLHAKPEMRTLWEGTSLLDLRLRCPKHLYSVYNNELSAQFFQVLEEGTWVDCGDPR